MNIKHFDIKHNGTAWYGCQRIGCPPYITAQLDREMAEAHVRGMFSERECEVDCFISVLSELEDCFTFLDLGSGWGEWTLALGGVARKGLIPHRFTDYHTYALECDSKFYGALLQNTLSMDLLSQTTPIRAAIADRCGKARINKGLISEKYCGSSLTFDGYFSDSSFKARLLGLAHYLAGETDQVDTLTIDELVDRKNTFIVMDVQGAELLALKGASSAIRWGMIAYMLIGTHGAHLHNKVKDILKERFEIVVDAQPNSVTVVNDRYKVFCQKGQDGILLCKRKSISV